MFSASVVAAFASISGYSNLYVGTTSIHTVPAGRSYVLRPTNPVLQSILPYFSNIQRLCICHLHHLSLLGIFFVDAQESCGVAPICCSAIAPCSY
jgi:hypothetical protein